MFDAVRQPVRAARRLGREAGRITRSLFTSPTARDYAGNERGSVAIIFGLTAFVVVTIVGGAVDFGRAYNGKAKLQATLDSASLASAAAYLHDPNHDVTNAIAHGQNYFNAIMSNEPGATMTSTLNVESQTVTMTASMPVKTPFLTLVGINTITLAAYSEATTTETLGGQGKEVELSLMLDITGSMAWASGGAGSGTKLAAMQTASKSFVDVLIPNTGTPKAKISLAPFAERLRLSDAQIQLVTGEPLVKTTSTTSSYQCNPTETCLPATCRSFRGNGTCRDWNDPVCTTTYQTCTSTTTETKYLSRCVTERTGADAFSDAAPASGSYFPAAWKSSESSAKSCAPGATEALVPLTSNKTTLKATIDAFSTHGATAGHIGTAWAWYTLAPSWGSVFTGTSAPGGYNQASKKKIAVLMTDGQYNTYYAKDGGGNPIQGDSAQQAKDLCDGMKAKGIEVYTVGFKLDDEDAVATLNYCATDANHAFLAEDAAQLEAAFREVAFRAVPLHLAK